MTAVGQERAKSFDGARSPWSAAGLSSARATTTAVVVDRPNLQIGDLADALTDSLERGGWLRGSSENEQRRWWASY